MPQLCHAKHGLSWGRAIILKSLSTLDYDRAHYTFYAQSRWTIGRQAGLRRDTDFMAGKKAVSARSFGRPPAFIGDLDLSVELNGSRRSE